MKNIKHIEKVLTKKEIADFEKYSREINKKAELLRSKSTN